MATISTDPETVLAHLRKEARMLIALGLDHPKRAAEIGAVVVAYHRLMTAVKLHHRSKRRAPMPMENSSTDQTPR